MSRLPIPGSDDGQWGNILNTFLSVEHAADGTLKLRTDGTLNGLYTKPVGGIPKADLASSVQVSLAKVDSAVQTVNGKTPNASGGVVIGEADIGSLSSDLAAKASDASVVHLAGSEIISGAKTFSAGLIASQFTFTAAPAAGFVLTSDAAGNASWQDTQQQNIAYAIALG